MVVNTVVLWKIINQIVLVPNISEMVVYTKDSGWIVSIQAMDYYPVLMELLVNHST